jgi:hypothetical protein
MVGSSLFLRRLAVFVALGVLCAGAVDWHAFHGSHGAEGEVDHAGHELLAYTGDGVTATDCDPDQPRHMEEGVPTQRGHCPACLHKVRTSGGEATAHRSLVELPAVLVSHRAHAERAADRRHSPRSLRGPPLA